MAFVVTARHSGNSGQTAVQTLTTDSVTPTSDSLLLAFWGAERNNHSQAESFSISGGSLSWAAIADTAAFAWDGLSVFSVAATLRRATVGGSPSAFAITVDSWATTNTGYYGAVCCDVTGHDATTPIVQSATNGASLAQGDNNSGTVTLATTPATGNLVVVEFSAGADTGGGFAAPTFGGQAMTQLHNQNASFHQAGLWYRVITGAETNNTITCSDLGNSVGNFAAIAVEVAAEAGGATAIGRVTATGTARTLTANKTVTIGRVTGVGEARAFGSAKTKAIGRVIELGTARTLGAAKTRQVGRITETGVVRSFTVEGDTTIGRVVEAGVARPLTAEKTTQLGRVTEAGDVRPLVQVFTFGRITETGATGGFAASKAKPLSRVTEVGTARGMLAGVPPQSIVISQGLHSLTATSKGSFQLTAAAAGLHDLNATAAGTHSLTATANGAHDLIAETEGNL